MASDSPTPAAAANAPDFIRPNVRAMHGYTPGEQPQDRRYVKLNTNENPYPPSPRALQAARGAADELLRRYPDPLAQRLREQAADVYGFRPAQIIAGNGSDDLLAMVMRACVAPGDRVAYPYPTYSLYDTLVELNDAVAVRCPFGPDFALPVDLEHSDARVIFLCNPNSPSGTQIARADICRLSERTSGLLVVDEAYVDFADENALPLVRERDNVMVLRTFSKSFSLAGLRVGLAFAGEPIIRQLLKVKDSYNLDRVSLAAAVAALEDLDGMHANVARVRATRARLTQGLQVLGFEVPPSQANFVLARRRGQSAGPLYEQLREKGILVRWFDTPELRDCLRITVGTDEEIDTLLAALRDL